MFKLFYNIIIGECENDKRHGNGKITFGNGDVYEGEWVNGKRCGNCKFTWKDGSVYEGECENDKQHGKGKITHTNGDVYEGNWEYGKRSGIFTYTYTNGRVLRFHIYDNKIKFTSYIDSDGISYDGQIKIITIDSSKSLQEILNTITPIIHGNGIMKKENHFIQTGIFENGIFKSGIHKIWDNGKYREIQL